jgi:hypothetical protein
VIAVEHKERSSGKSDRHWLECRRVEATDGISDWLGRTVGIDVGDADMRVVLIYRRTRFPELSSAEPGGDGVVCGYPQLPKRFGWLAEQIDRFPSNGRSTESHSRRLNAA